MSHRLEKYGFCLVNSLLKTNAGGRLKCHLVGVHGVIAAFVYRNFDVDHGISRQHALTHGFLHALVDGRNEAAWNVASYHFIHKLISCIGIGLNAKPAVTILSGTTGLLLMTTLRACHAADGLTIWDTERHFMGAHPGTGFQTIKQHGYLRFTNGGDDRLSGILIALNAKRGVCGSGLLQKRKEFTLRTALVGLNGNAIERVGEAERRSFNLTRRRKRISRQHLKLGNHHDVSRSGAGNVGGLTTTHAIQMRKTLGLTCARIDELNTRLKRSRQYFQECQTTVLRILQRFEGKRNRTLVIRRNIELLAIHQRNAAKISHLREPALNGVHKGDNAFLTYTRAGKYRYKHAVNQRFIEQTLKLFLSDLATVKIAHHELIVGFNHQLGQSGARIGCGSSVFLGYIFHYRFPVYQMASLLVHDVNHATKRLAGAHGNCY